MSFSEYDDNKLEDVLYLGEVCEQEDGKKYRKAELIFNMDEVCLEKVKSQDVISANIVEDLLLYKSSGGQQKIFCWIEEYKQGHPFTYGLRISRRTAKGVYGGQEICLDLEATLKLKKFLENIFTVDFNNKKKTRIDIDKFIVGKTDIKTVKISKEDFESILSYNIEHIENYNSIIEIKKREKAIERLEEIISNKHSYKNEVEINKFLEENLWMFNNEYVFFSKNNRINTKNILDLVPKTFDGYVDIVELKLPSVEIMHFDSSHKNYYPSSDLTKAIAQCMNYILELEKLLANNPSFLRPKATIIIGNNKDLTTEENQFLRVLNSSYHNIKIYTYQNLLEKAKNSLSFTKRTKNGIKAED